MIQKSEKWFKISIVVAIVLTIMIIVLNPILSDVELMRDQGSQWYKWKLPVRNNLTMIIVWSLFFGQLFGNFFLIYKRIKVKEVGFHKYNLYLLFYNFIFIILHFIESIFLYDGLAQDVPIWTSQYSVIFILVILIVMQINTRGLILGYKIKLPAAANKFMFKWHGVLFATAIIYTFWYHPFVNTIGHLSGFFYMFLLLIQVSFIKNKIHYNKYWILILEVFVALHGASVAYFVQNSTMWSMFLFGFLFIFFMTQIYTLNIHPRLRLGIQCIYFLVVIAYYGIYNISKIHQILWIPTIEYLGALIIIGLSFLFFKVLKKNKIS